MASPMPGGGMPRMPRQPGVPGGPGTPIVDRFGGNNGRLGDMRPLPVKKPKRPKMTIQPMPKPGAQYAPVNKSKMVNKVYKTY